MVKAHPDIPDTIETRPKDMEILAWKNEQPHQLTNEGK